MDDNTQRTLTFGERAVGLTFNPSGDPAVHECKAGFAKLIDQMRPEWGFRGILVKFKLEVGVGEGQLLEIAERSRRHSAADLMVANTLEGAASWAFLGPVGGEYQRVDRRELAQVVLQAVETLHEEKKDG